MKKILLVGLTLAVISGILTLWTVPMFGSQYGFMNSVIQGNVQSMPMHDRVMVSSPGMEIMPEPWPPYEDPSVGLDSEQRYYDQYADVSYVVSDVSSYLRSFREFLLSQGARVTSYSQGTSQDYSYGYLTAEVPMDAFDTVLTKSSEGVEKVVGENQSISDVTSRVVQLENEQRSLEQQIAQLQVERDEAETATDRSRIGLRITELERQLQSVSQRAASVEESTRYGTISLSVADEMRHFDPSARGTWQEELRRAFESLGGSLQAIGLGLIWVGVYALVWIPVLLAGRWVLGLLRRPTR